MSNIILFAGKKILWIYLYLQIYKCNQNEDIY
jgi:hypothetical protein